MFPLNFLTARDPQDLSSDFISKVRVLNLRSLQQPQNSGWVGLIS